MLPGNMLQTTYTNLASEYNSQFLAQKKRSSLFAWLRLLVFIVILFLVYLYYNATLSGGVFFCTLLLSIGAFFYVLKQHVKIAYRIRHYELLMQINLNELKCLAGDHTPFGDGAIFTDPEHAYTYDLDIFGAGSLFQHVNRTETVKGQRSLANYFSRHLPIDVKAQQEAIKELAPKLNWRQHFLATSKQHTDSEAQLTRLQNWLKWPFAYKDKKGLLVLFKLLPIITITTIFLYAVPGINLPTSVFNTLFLINLFITAANMKHITREHEALTEISEPLGTYSKLLKAIETENFQSKRLNQLKQTETTAAITASGAIAELSKILNAFDGRYNVFAGVLFNGTVLYNINTIVKLEKWKSTYADLVINWLQIIAEFEVLSSIANYSYNNADFVFPELRSDKGLDAQQLGHPLILASKRVCNDVELIHQKFITLTGSNMSGKSTFLRTLGTNLVLANIGAPVCAKHFSFYPFDIFASMRVSDSLQKSESFFYAELQRLKRVVDHLEEGNATFVLLDEILRGTNSNDKHIGTKGLIIKLVALKAVGVIATHDLTIGELTQQYGDYLKNQCFEVEIINNELYFDYLLRDGVAKNRSATFLMEKMQII